MPYCTKPAGVECVPRMLRFGWPFPMVFLAVQHPHLASRFWMETFMQHGDAFGRFLCQYHGQFCEAMTEAHFGSAATFVSATITPDGQCHVCNVGDSRAYRINAAGVWQQVSHDHTILAELIEQGQAQADQHYSGLYHALTQCLIADSGKRF